MVANDAATYLSVSDAPADCAGFVWPCRLFEVEPEGETLTGMDYPHKVAGLTFRVISELPAWQAFGPTGEAVEAFIARCRRLTPDEVKRLAAARNAARGAARGAARDAATAAARGAATAAARDAAWGAVTWDAAWDAAWDAVAWDAARDAAWDAAWDAARAILVKDLIPPKQYDLMTQSWRDAGLDLA